MRLNGLLMTAVVALAVTVAYDKFGKGGALMRRGS